MCHIILSDPQQTFGTYGRILPSNKVCFRQILISVKIIPTPQFTLTGFKISGKSWRRAAFTLGNWVPGQGRDFPQVSFYARYHLLLEIHLPPCLCHRRPTCVVSIKGFLHTGLWLGWTMGSRMKGQWEKNEDSLFPGSLPRGPLEWTVSPQKILAFFKGSQLQNRAGSSSSSTQSLPLVPSWAGPNTQVGYCLPVSLQHTFYKQFHWK